MSNTAQKMTPERLQKEFGITVTAEFVPYSKSRHFKEGAKLHEKSLNWRVTVLKDTGMNDVKRLVTTTDYSAGIAHCPSYKQKISLGFTEEEVSKLTYEVEHGKTGQFITVSTGDRMPRRGTEKLILPDPCDVLYCLLSDASAIDYATYEEWAPAFGFDEDSRKGEQIYKQCLEIGLKMRVTLGDQLLQELRDAFQDY